MTGDDSGTLAPLFALPPTDVIDWVTYRRIMGTRGWHTFRQLIRATRDYAGGLEAGFRLLRATGRHRDRLGQKQYERQRITLYLHILRMLDMADQWDTYLEAWHAIRKGTDLSMNYCAETMERSRPRIDPFILGPARPSTTRSLSDGISPNRRGPPGPAMLRVHFLWAIEHRRELILCKLTRQREGKLTGNLRHKQRENLSQKEVKERIEWVRSWPRHMGLER